MRFEIGAKESGDVVIIGDVFNNGTTINDAIDNGTVGNDAATESAGIDVVTP